MIADDDGMKAIADHSKATHGHFYPIAHHLDPIVDRMDHASRLRAAWP